jgi:twitching motility protein PilT
MPSRIYTFLELAVKQGASDLHLVSGQPPCIRIRGTLHRVRFRTLSVEDVMEILHEFMTPQQLIDLDKNHAVDLGYDVEELGRFRVNVYRHVRGLAAALRVIPTVIPALDDLGFPNSVKLQTLQPKGLTLVTGPTGSGKSTTLAAMIDLLNQTRRGHIITIEDPIEFVHDNRSCVVSQREIGIHAPSFAEALRSALREDPDVILVGELRDLESISLALTAAETGIQVLGTLHTGGAAQTVDRVINVFPARRQDQIRSMLADSLRMVISQRLVRTTDGTRRLAVAEVLVNTYAASSMMRGGNSHKLDSLIQTGSAAGMQSLDARLLELVRNEVITAEEAFDNAIEKSQFERLVVRQVAA